MLLPWVLTESKHQNTSCCTRAIHWVLTKPKHQNGCSRAQNQNIKIPHVVPVPYIGYSQNQNIKIPHVVPVPYIGYSQNQNIKIPHVVPVLCDCVFPTLRPECAVQSSAILLFNVAMRLYGYYCNSVITCQIVFAASNQRDNDHCQLKTLNV